jgi:hypothetical protein
VAAGTVSTWENHRNPAPLPEQRLEPYARLFASSRSWTDKPHLVPEAELTSEEKARRDEVLAELRELWLATRIGTTQQASSHRSWFFYDDGPLTIICPDAPEGAMGPLAAPSNPNYTELHAYADVDALMELWGHIRAENSTTFAARFKRASQFDADDLSGHVVLLGGIAWNELTRHVEQLLQRLLPVRQVELKGLTTGDIFEITQNGEESRFLPVWDTDDPRNLTEDVAFLARIANPFNSTRTLTICNGIHGRGVVGAVRALTDELLRDSNEAYLAERFPRGEFAVLLRVLVINGRALSPDLRQPQTRLYEWPAAK